MKREYYSGAHGLYLLFIDIFMARFNRPPTTAAAAVAAATAPSAAQRYARATLASLNPSMIYDISHLSHIVRHIVYSSLLRSRPCTPERATQCKTRRAAGR